MKKSLLVFAAIFLSSVLTLTAQNIILVTDVAAGDGPYVECLQAEGYTVEAIEQKYRNLTDALVPELNAADLIIFTRRITSSGAYGGTDPLVRARWQSITTPILQMADVVARMSRTQLLNNDTPNGSVNKYMVVKSPGHAVFTNTMLNSHDSTKLLTNEVYQCTSATDAGTGTLLATDPVNGWVTMAEWDSNAACYSGAGVQNGRRFWYAASNSYNYTAEGERLFLDIVEYMLTKNVTDKLAASDIQLSDSTILEGKPSGTVIGLLSDNDPQGNTAMYSLVAGTGDTDNAGFTIVGDTLKSNTVFDFEDKDSLFVRIRVTDSASNTFEKTFTLFVIGHSPTDIILSNSAIVEGKPKGSAVGKLSALDPLDDIAFYSLVTGHGDDNNASFTIDGDSLRTDSVFVYVNTKSLSVRIGVTDSASNTFEKEFSISVLSLTEPVDIHLSNSTIHEDEPVGTVIGVLKATDPQNNIASFELVSGTGDEGNSAFTISNDALKSDSVFNYEDTPLLTVRIRVTDSTSNVYEEVFTITVISNAPTDITLSNFIIVEGEPENTVVGVLSAVDPQDDIASYALVAGTGDSDNTGFTIDGDTLRTATVFDYEVIQSLSVRIRVTDSASNVYDKVFIITVAGHTPTDIILSNNLITEGEPAGTTVGGLSAFDTQDDIASYTLVAGEGDDDNASFAIDGDTLRTAAVFNYDNTQSLSVRIQVTDLASNTYQKVFTINVQDKPSSVNYQVTNIPDIYPNPARDYLIIKDVERFAGSIYSISGQTVMTIEYSNANLDISALEAGMYIMSITTEGGQYVYRFIKE
ncbi:MAG: T9SS type A sorting domain-containing protein [Bacteroidales bacterium]|nr:T9SS type A sorting domain-containing protein [Bacteroidales bacterium]